MHRDDELSVVADSQDAIPTNGSGSSKDDLLNSIDGPFQLAEYLACKVRADPHDVKGLVEVPKDGQDADRDVVCLPPTQHECLGRGGRNACHDPHTRGLRLRLEVVLAVINAFPVIDSLRDVGMT
jgi:hypothetical protein